MHPCERCGAPIDDKYRICYHCMKDEQEAIRESHKARGSPYNARTGYTTTYVASQPNNASERKETTIMEAHEENIIAQTQLTTAVKDLADAVEHLTGMLRIMQSWSENMSKPIEGKGSQ